MKMYLASTLIVLGAIAALAGPFLPSLFPQEKIWSPEDAKEHSVAAATLHKAAHDAVFTETVDENASSEDVLQAKQALEAAETRFERSYERLEKAQFWQTTFPNYLRFGGSAAALLGLLIYAAERGKSD